MQLLRTSYRLYARTLRESQQEGHAWQDAFATEMGARWRAMLASAPCVRDGAIPGARRGVRPAVGERARRIDAHASRFPVHPFTVFTTALLLWPTVAFLGLANFGVLKWARRASEKSASVERVEETLMRRRCGGRAVASDGRIASESSL